MEIATRAVIAGESAFERDGFTFNETELRWPILAGLLQAHARDGYLSVIDVGGALGSLYWQHRQVLIDLNVNWAVVEQEEFVDRGRQLPSNEVRFFTGLDEALSTTNPNVVLFSSVLQYLDKPIDVVGQIISNTNASIIIDRTPLSDSPRNIPTIQHVPAHIYAGSYAAWIISNSELSNALAEMSSLYRFPGIEPETFTSRGTRLRWQGLWALRGDSQ